MKKEYIRPEYDTNNQLEDIMTVSYEVSENGDTITGIVDIEELFGISST